MDVPDNTIWSARKERRIILIKRVPLHNILVQSGTLLEPGTGFKVHQRSADITGNVSDGRAGEGCGAQIRAIRIGMDGDSVLC